MSMFLKAVQAAGFNPVDFAIGGLSRAVANLEAAQEIHTATIVATEDQLDYLKFKQKEVKFELDRAKRLATKLKELTV